MYKHVVLKVFTLLLIIVSFSLIIPKAFAATTYYISPSGSDSANGSQATPWKTLNKACNNAPQIVSGDIIHINAGTYSEGNTCTLRVGISIEGDGASTTIIQTSVNGDYQKAFDMSSSAEGTNGNQHVTGITLDGVNYTTSYWGFYIVGRSNVSLYNNIIKNYKDSGVIFSGRTDNTNNPPTVYSANNSFHDNVMTNCAQYVNGNGQGCVEIGGQLDMQVYNNNITQDQRPDGQNGWPLKFYLDGHFKGLKVYNNTLTKKVFVAPYGGGPIGTIPGNGDWDFAVELWNCHGGCEMYNNTIQGGVDLAYNSKTTYTRSWWVHDNVITNPVLPSHYQHGIIFERDVEGALVENNFISNVYQGIIFYIEDFSGGVTHNYLSDITIQKNLFSNIGRQGFPGGSGGGIGTQTNSVHSPFDLTNFTIQNNTIVAATGNEPTEGIALDGADSPATINNVNFINNIVQGFTLNSLRVTYSGTFNTLNIKNNDFYGNGSNTPVFSTPVTSGYVNSGNLISSPQFAETTNYTLSSTSPLINAGVNVGLAYNSTAPDIGYAESNFSGGGGGGGDTTPPTVSSVIPTSGSTGNSTSTAVTATFSEALNPVNVSAVTAYITGVTSSVSYSNNVVTITPSSPLTSNTTYTVNLTTGITDVAGNHLASNYTYTFTTGTTANILPVANAGPDQTITLPTSSVTLSGSGTDQDGTIVSHTWSQMSGPNTATFSSTTSYTPTVTNLVQGSYTFWLTVTDNSGGQNVDQVLITVNPSSGGSSSVTVNPGTNQSISAATATLTGSATTSNGTSGTGKNYVLYSSVLSNPVWSTSIPITDNQAVDGAGNNTLELLNISSGNGGDIHQVVNGLTPNTTYYFSFDFKRGTNTGAEYQVIDWNSFSPINSLTSYYSSTSASVSRVQLSFTTPAGCSSVYIKVYNSPFTNGTLYLGRVQLSPTANDTYADTSGTAITTSSGGSGATITGYSWSKFSGPSAGSITSPNSASTGLTGLAQGTYVFRLTATDSTGATGTGDVTVTVNGAANILPVANAGVDQTITLPTSSVSLSGSGSSDSDGTISTYLWSVVQGSGTITTPNAMNTTITGLTAGTSIFRLTVTDNSGGTAADDVNVVVNAAGSGGGGGGGGGGSPISCPLGTTGIYPNCTTITVTNVCPSGYTGIYPNCTKIVGNVCPTGTTGTYPNCVTPTPTPTGSPIYIPVTGITHSSSTALKKELQKFLNWSTGSTLVVDGKWGGKTIIAVKVFQTKYNLKADGSFGKVTAGKAIQLLKAGNMYRATL